MREGERKLWTIREHHTLIVGVDVSQEETPGV